MENNTSIAKQLELVFIPCPMPGHIVSMVEFAKRILSHHPHVRVTLLLMNPPPIPSTEHNKKNSSSSSSSTSAGGISRRHSSGGGRLRYINLPEVEPSPEEVLSEEDGPEVYVCTYIASHKSSVRAAIVDTANNTQQHHAQSAARIAAGIVVVVDMFCTPMMDVAKELGIPSYVFFTSGAGFLGVFLQLPALNFHFSQDGKLVVFPDNHDLEISTYANPLPFKLLPITVVRRTGYKLFSEVAKRFALETNGIIVNTCDELEPYATTSLSRMTSNGLIPPVYNVGPVLDLKGEAHGRNTNAKQKEHIMNWLDDQPDSSVVFLCFGSRGALSKPQVREIAAGLASSEVRFLWSLRNPPEDYTDSELKELLPGQFLSLLEEDEKRRRRGLVCGWAPQVEVLAHKAVGGFVSHCGWNSTLESLWFGVPIVAWPLYAEQHSNGFEIVKELGLGVELRLDYQRERGDLVRADEIQKAVKCLMDDHGGNNQVRARVKEVSEISKRALMEDSSGSSFVAMECLVKDIEKNIGG